MSLFRYECQACSADCLHEIAEFARLPRVTSDSKPFRRGGRLFVCERCGAVQKIADAEWRRETQEIYRGYDMYHQSTSNDQPVFDPSSGRPRGRCEVLVQRLLESGAIADSGTVLDVGAGTGAMLAAIAASGSGSRLFGLDLDNRKEQVLIAIPRFERLFTVPPEQVTQEFDLITLVHALEHFPDPVSMLRRLRQKVSKGGHVFVQVNNLNRTPFDLVVADHLCHFTPRSLAYLAGCSGLGVESVRTDWINKEISLLAIADPQAPRPMHDDPRQVIDQAKVDVSWLQAMLSHAGESARGTQFGIFGTSVAGTWLAGALGDAVEFFVDEDAAREGRTHLGRPIYRPDQIPRDATVYLAFVAEVSMSICRRLDALPVRFVAPPDAAPRNPGFAGAGLERAASAIGAGKT